MGEGLFEEKGEGTYIANLRYYDQGIDDYILRGFSEMVEISLNPQAKNLVVDLEKVERLNSSDIAEIISVYQILQEKEVKMYVCGKGQPARMLDLTGLTKLDIRFKDSLDQAIEEISGKKVKVQ